MTRKWLGILGVSLLAAQVSFGEPLVLQTEKEKVSYGIGIVVARNFKEQGIEVDVDVLVKALRDELSGAKLLMSEDDLRETLSKFQARLTPTDYKSQLLRSRVNADMRMSQNELRQRWAKMAEKNKKEGEAFLAENKKKEGVVTLPSGLQYKILKTGEGMKPKEADTVEVHYRGTLINGTEFDNSYSAGKPATFKVAQTILGWRKALQLMPVGSKWQLFVPPELAYGNRGAGGDIGPNATLIFEVELLAVK